MGVLRRLLSSFVYSLEVALQIDCGVDNEHEGDRIELLIVTFSTCIPYVFNRFFYLTVPAQSLVTVQTLTDQKS